LFLKFQPTTFSGASINTRIVDGGEVATTEDIFAGTVNCLPNISVIWVVLEF
jgi:hypothetical protein